MFNPHQILGVEESADMSTVKKRFKIVSKMFHPDKHGNDPSAVVIYQIIRSSYDTLKENKSKIVLPVLEEKIKQHIETPNSSVADSSSKITENDIKILGEKLLDPWGNPHLNLAEMFGDVNIPKSNNDTSNS